MNQVKTIPIALGEHSYNISIGSGLLQSAQSFEVLQPWITQASSAAVVTNSTVAPLYRKRLDRILKGYFAKVLYIILDDGEQYKNWQALDEIFNSMLRAACDRHTVMFALGGGVIGDITGFAAACYMRGVPYVQIPTTLLAQVDASVGGKTAINHPLGKNMIGAFYQPKHVLIDVETLSTLPKQELIAGFAEVIKHGAIADRDYLMRIDGLLPQLLQADAEALIEVVQGSVAIKAGVVSADERERNGKRILLNFGHTFAHAIEAGMGFGTWLHGHAVGAGMVAAAHLSQNELGFSSEETDQLIDIIARAELPITMPKFNIARYLELMRVDKKNAGNTLQLILLKQLGSACVKAVNDDKISQVLARLTH